MSCYDDNPELSEGIMAYLYGNAKKQEAFVKERERRYDRFPVAVMLIAELLEGFEPRAGEEPFAEGTHGHYLRTKARKFLDDEPKETA